MNLFLKNLELTERDKFLAYLTDFHIVDIGYIKTIENDKLFVDVIHATKTQVYNEEKGSYEEQEETLTKHIEVLYLGGQNFRIEHELKKGDVGLLLGTLSYIEKMRDVTEAKKSDFISNYRQENLKFLPIGNNEDPETLLKFLSNEINFETSIKNTTFNLKNELVFETDANSTFTINNNEMKINSDGFKLTCKNNNVWEMTSTGTKLTDKNNNVWETTSTGTKLTDAVGNTIETKSGEIDLNGSDHNAIFGDSLVTAFSTFCSAWSSLPTGTEGQNAAVLAAMQGACSALLTSLNSAKSNKVKLG